MLPIESESVQRAIFWICRAAVFGPGAVDAIAEFTSARSQVLNQGPGLTNC